MFQQGYMGFFLLSRTRSILIFLWLANADPFILDSKWSASERTVSALWTHGEHFVNDERERCGERKWTHGVRTVSARLTHEKKESRTFQELYWSQVKVLGRNWGSYFLYWNIQRKIFLKSSQAPYCQNSCNLCDPCGCRMSKKRGGGNLTELIEKNLYISSFQTRMVKKSCNICESIPKKCRFKLVKVRVGG